MTDEQKKTLKSILRECPQPIRGIIQSNPFITIGKVKFLLGENENV